MALEFGQGPSGYHGLLSGLEWFMKVVTAFG